MPRSTPVAASVSRAAKEADINKKERAAAEEARRAAEAAVALRATEEAREQERQQREREQEALRLRPVDHNNFLLPCPAACDSFAASCGYRIKVPPPSWGYCIKVR
jgi:hypothetical protein